MSFFLSGRMRDAECRPGLVALLAVGCFSPFSTRGKGPGLDLSEVEGMRRFLTITTVLSLDNGERIPHLLSDLSPNNWPYFKPLTELAVTSNYAFHQDCGLPAAGFDGPFTTSATACAGISPVIKASCNNPNELCCSYSTSTRVSSSLWKIEISCSDADPFTNGSQPFQFIYEEKAILREN